MLPSEVFLVKGRGQDRECLTSFDYALRDAGISQFNLVQVSSIFPPHCRLIKARDGLAQMRAGQITYCVLSKNDTNEACRLISASIGLAIPKDRSQFGYLSEHSAEGEGESEAGRYAEKLAVMMLASKLGVSVDATSKHRDNWHIDEKIYKTRSICQVAQGESGLWTSVMAAAIFLGGDR